MEREQALKTLLEEIEEEDKRERMKETKECVCLFAFV